MRLDLSSFYSSLLVIALIIALGFILGKTKKISQSTNKQLVNLLLIIFMPASLFNAFPGTYSEEYGYLFLMGFLAGLLIMLTMILVGKLIYHEKIFHGELSYEGQFAFIFNNATFLGYPIISSAFGEQGIIPYCGFIIAFNLALFSYGIWLFERKLTPRFFVRVLTNPNIIAVVLGLIFFFTQIAIPDILKTTVGYVSNITTPLSLICIGYMLSTAEFRSLVKKWRLLLVAAIQLTISPLLTFLILNLLQFPSEVIIVCTLIQALPTATSLGLFAQKYGGKDAKVDEASEIVVISTTMSMLTLPLITLLLK
ncbi:AEC family transporter [Candidatus Saccharibacteria bacterium]|nr:AEC family transporter [Candidatus Saccharibacteria bacterium]